MMRLGAIALAIMLSAPLATPAGAAGRALVLDVDGVIGPAIADYVVREIDSASPNEVGLIVLRMNTPGGLDTSMREINTAILASLVPVATFVAPSGARAASAGTYIAYASAIAAMAPGTNIGAATPIAARRQSADAGRRFAAEATSARQANARQAIARQAIARQGARANARQGRRAGEHRDAQDGQRCGRLYPQPRRGERAQRRLGRRRGALRREPAGRRSAQAACHRRHRHRRPRSAAPDRRPRGDGRRQAAAARHRGACRGQCAAGLAHQAARADHQSERRLHPDADRDLRADPRILQSRRCRPGPGRRHQPAGRVLCAGAHSDRLCRRRARHPRHRADGRRSPYRQLSARSASAALPLSSSAP